MTSDEVVVDSKEEIAEKTGTADEVAAKTTSAKMALAIELLSQVEGMLTQVRQLIQTSTALPVAKFSRTAEFLSIGEDDSRVIEGVFDGQKMIGPDGKHYSVPANYASKSKLVEGDLLKLTITSKGAFIFKQIGPIARRRLSGILKRNQTGSDYSVKAGDRHYRVLTASITYFRGHEGDETIILVPESGESRWAAVENIVKSANQPEWITGNENEFEKNKTNSVNDDDLDINIE